MMIVQNNNQDSAIGVPLIRSSDQNKKKGITLSVKYKYYNSIEPCDSEDIANIQHNGEFMIWLQHGMRSIFRSLRCGSYRSLNRALYEAVEFLKAYNKGEHEYVFPDEQDISESLDLSKMDCFLELWDEVDKIKMAEMTLDALVSQITF